MAQLEIDNLEFRSPVAIYRRPDGTEVPLYFTPVWQRRLKAIWDLLKVLNGGTIIGPNLDMDAAGFIGATGSDGMLMMGTGSPDPLQAIRGLLEPTVPTPADDSAFMELPSAPVMPNFFTLIRDTAANLAGYPAAGFADAYYLETDTFVARYSDGTNWIEILMPALLKFLGATNAYPALKRSGTILQVRLADDSAYSALEVLDEAYGAGWNGKVEVPTKNGVYDEMQLRLKQNGVNFGPAAVASITVVNGQVTAIS